MIDTPPVCLSCNGTLFKFKPVEVWVKNDENKYTMITQPAFECEWCGTPAMNAEQMDNLLKELRIYKKKHNTSD